MKYAHTGVQLALSPILFTEMLPVQPQNGVDTKYLACLGALLTIARFKGLTACCQLVLSQRGQLVPSIVFSL